MFIVIYTYNKMFEVCEYKHALVILGLKLGQF